MSFVAGRIMMMKGLLSRGKIIIFINRKIKKSINLIMLMTALLVFMSSNSIAGEDILTIGGSPVSGAIATADSFQFYRLEGVTEGEHLIFQLDVKDTDDRDELYVRRGALPTLQEYDFVANSNRADQFLEIDSAQAGTYYVMVYGKTDAWPGWEDGYTLRVDNDDTLPILTVGGSPVSGAIETADSFQFYRLEGVTEGEHLIFHLDVKDTDDRDELYVRRGALPTLHEYDFVANSNRADQFLEIDSAQAGTYYVMVYGKTDAWPGWEDGYTLRVDNDDTLPILTVGGSPVSGAIATADSFQFYRLEGVTEGEHLIFQLDVKDTDDRDELYVRRGALPTLQEYDFVANSNRADQFLEIDSAQAGTYYVMVYGKTDAWPGWEDGYTLQVQPAATLGAGETVDSNISAGGTHYYTMKPTGGAVYFLLDNHGDDDLRLYLSLGAIPSPASHDYDNSTGIVAPQQDANFSYCLAVQGGKSDSTYSVRVTNNLPSIGGAESVVDTIEFPGQDRFYKFVLPETGQSLISLKTAIGTGYQLIACKDDFPDTHSPQKTAILLTTEDTLLYLSGTPGETWYLMLDNSSEGTGTLEFFCQDSVQQLIEGVPIHDSFPLAGFRAYRFNKNSDHNPLYISADSADGTGDLQLFVSDKALSGSYENKIHSMAGMGATRTAVLTNFDDGEYWVTVMPSEDGPEEFDIRLESISPAQQKINNSQNVIRLDRENRRSYTFTDTTGNTILLSYSGTGSVDVLFRNVQEISPGNESAPINHADIDTILIKNDPGTGTLVIKSTGNLTIGSLFSENASLRSLSIKAESFTGDIYVSGRIRNITSIGDLDGSHFIAVAERMNVKGNLLSDTAFSRLPQKIAISGDLDGSLTGIGDTTATIGGNFMGVMDIIGNISLKGNGQFGGSLAAVNAKNLSFGSISPQGVAVIYNDMANLSLKNASGGFKGGLMVGNNIGSIKIPNIDMDGWIKTNGVINTLKVNKIGGIVSASNIKNINIGSGGLTGLVDCEHFVDSISSKSGLNGTIIAKDGLGTLSSPAIDHLNFFSAHSINNLQLGSKPLSADGIFVTGEPIELPANISFTGTLANASAMDLPSARDLAKSFANRLNIPVTAPINTRVNSNLDRLVTDLTPVWNKPWVADTFQNTSWKWVDTSAFNDYQPRNAIVDIITEPIPDLITTAISYQAPELDVAVSTLSTVYSLVDGGRKLGEFFNKPTMSSYIKAIGGLASVTCAINDIGMALAAGGLSTLPEVALGTSVLGTPIVMNTAILGGVMSGQQSLIDDQFKISNYMMNESIRSLQSGNNSYALTALNRYNTYMDNLNIAFNPDIFANFGNASGGINWDSYYNSTFGNYTCDYGSHSYGFGSSLGSYGSIGSIGSSSFGSTGSIGSSSFGSFGRLGGW
jgi:serine protease